MRCTVQFSPMEDPALQTWRDRYCRSLEKAQALLLEMMVPVCEAIAIHRKGECIGYALVNPDKTLIEYFVEPREWMYAQEIAAQLVAEHKIPRAIVKSFDALMLSTLMHIQKEVRVLGYLARDYQARSLPAHLVPSMRAEIASMDKLDEICAMRQEVFRDPSRFAQAIAAQEVIGYWDKEALLGFGMLRRVRADQEALEINIAVDPAYRRRAYGAYMLEDLVKRCVAQGMTPIASCPVDNRASQLVGERVGLSSRDRLLSLSF